MEPAPQQTKEQEPPIEGTFTVLERSAVMKWFSRGLQLVGVLFFVGLLAHVFPPGVIGLHMLLIGSLLGLSQRKNNYSAVRRERTVRITREGVWVDGKLEVPREKIADGFFQPRPKRNPKKKRSHDASVRLFDKKKNLIFEVEAEEGRALEILHRLGLDPTSKRAEFRGSSPLYATVPRNMAFVWTLIASTALVAFLVKAIGLGPFSPLVGALFFLPMMIAGVWPSKIEVGIDGIVVRWLWRKKFIPMSQILSVTRNGDRQVVLHLASGKSETLYVSTARARGSFAVQKRDAVLARILEAQAAFKSGAKAADVSALVGRGSRTRSEWLSALTKLRQQDGGYRQAVVRDEDLWRVIEDPTAPEDARAGAAMALRPALDDAGRSRVRVAAGATASPRLRVAFDAAASDADSSEQAMAAALEELAEEAEDAEKKAAAG